MADAVPEKRAELRAYLATTNITAAEMAAATGLEQVRIARLLKGASRPEPGEMAKLRAAVDALCEQRVARLTLAKVPSDAEGLRAFCEARGITDVQLGGVLPGCRDTGEVESALRRSIKVGGTQLKRVRENLLALAKAKAGQAPRVRTGA